MSSFHSVIKIVLVPLGPLSFCIKFKGQLVNLCQIARGDLGRSCVESVDQFKACEHGMPSSLFRSCNISPMMFDTFYYISLHFFH